MAVTAAASAREILVNLHEVMAARSSPQAKLDAVVRIIGEALDSEVCSIYLLREGLLELYATKGLDQAAVHVTKLAPGEGLVGTIAQNVETLNLDEAASHPDFAYRPETGEDEFHSFAGVPIIRRERAIGVLAVQHVDPHKYEDVEIEALQTVAMVLSELIASAGLADQRDAASRPQSTAAVRLDGLKLVEGMGVGHAVYHQPRITIEHTVAEDTEAERHRVYAAFDKMREQIDRMADRAEFGVGGEHDEVLSMYKMFAYDEGWSRRINEAIDSGLTAEAAIERVQQRTRMRMRQIGDPLLQDRMHDLEDLSNRLLRIVSGQMGTAAQFGLRQDTILIARNLGPAELLEYDRRRLKGVILEEGSLTAHVIIVARAMGVPVLGRVRSVRQHVGEGDQLLLDVTGNGSALVRPSAAMEEAFDAKLLLRQKRRAVFAALRDEAPITRDGVRLTVMCNAGLRDDVAALDVTGADGIGLFRTEFQFLVSATLPQRERQLRLYKDVLEAAGDKPVVFRTVDIGGDKALPYLNTHDEDEENPAMGWRALRLALERGGLMKAQARALIEAAGGRTLNVMFPMVSEPWEFDEAKAIFETQKAWLGGRGKRLPNDIRYGAMLEVPALAEQLDLLLPNVQFLSVGTNDLTQFLFAADRANPKLAERYDWLSPSILRFLKRVVAPCRDAGVDLAVCGEMGGRPLEAMALVGLGIERLSITPAAVGPIKAMVRSLDRGAIAAEMDRLLSAPIRDVRGHLIGWAAENGVELA
ncbi:phosphoenolpyruvate--protein phosphotransferase [Sphingomonas bacterium]|uniref:phosphoenolpyruvate--protein phosphotransferase n=1 Tax=Sphingomonas bacterium TaxID=1895847 RepID=UPI002614A845|nr:phosphoenolpyruvate--protein phosphotransferase [Sphingomonas bacterium]MDB5679911.1 peptidase [Sphingomonas bacterium]